MTKQERIDQLKRELQKVFDDLHGLVAGGAPDAEKEKLADIFNDLVGQIDAMQAQNALRP